MFPLRFETTTVNRISREKNKRRAFVPTDPDWQGPVGWQVRRKHSRIPTNRGSPSRQGSRDPGSWCEICRQILLRRVFKARSGSLSQHISASICSNSVKFVSVLSVRLSVSVSIRRLLFCTVIESFQIHFFSFVLIFFRPYIFFGVILPFNLNKKSSES